MVPLDLVRSIKHGCVQFESDDAVVIVDPYLIKSAKEDADLIVITHGHKDHFSREDIEKARKDGTCFVSVKKVCDALEKEFGIDDAYITEMNYDSPMTVFECGASVEPVIAQNKNHSIDEGFGVVLRFGGFTYYISGDTDVLAEDIKCDVLFVCCDGIYNMPNFETEIPKAILSMDVMPKLVVPYHCDETPENAHKLCEALSALDIPCQEWDD